MNIIWLQIASLVYVLLLMVVFFSKKRLKSVENSAYKNLLVANIFGLLLELACFYTTKHVDIMRPIAILCDRLLLVYYMLFTMFYSYYVLIISKNHEDIDSDSKQKKLKKYKVICTIIFIISSIIISMLPIELYSKGNIVYSYGQSIEVFKGILVIIMFWWLFVVIKNIKNIKARKYLPIILFILLAGLTGTVQNKYPELLLTTPVETFIIFLMFFTIENPDMRMIAELNRTKNKIEKNNADNSKFLYKVTEDLRNSSYEMNEVVNRIAARDIDDDTREDIYKLRYLLSNNRNKLNDALDISSLDIKNIKITNSKYELSKIIKEVELRLKDSINDGVKFNIDIAETIPDMLYGESVKMKQILTTLLINAFEHTKEGSVDLRCNCLVKDKICRLFIIVEDTGEGMSLQQINDLTLNDQTLTDEDIEQYNELNLNLKIVKKIIQVMGGSFNIDSNEDKGTKVIVTLNQKIYEDDSKELKDISKIEKQLFSKKNIVVISNSVVIRKNVLKTLAKEDFNIIEYEYAKECLDMIRKGQKIDLIICQENMDKIDARGLLDKFNKEEISIPILLVSEREDYDLKRVKIEGFASAISDKEMALDLIKKVNMIINK